MKSTCLETITPSYFCSVYSVLFMHILFLVQLLQIRTSYTNLETERSFTQISTTVLGLGYVLNKFASFPIFMLSKLFLRSSNQKVLRFSGALWLWFQTSNRKVKEHVRRDKIYMRFELFSFPQKHCK